MRTIQLFDAEANKVFKDIGRILNLKAEEAKAINNDQHGSRKQQRSILACLCKVLLMDSLQQRKQAGAIAMNDAKGCYDRIQHVIAILVLMSFGLDYTPAKLMFQTLQEAKHCIKTGYGVSDNM